MDAYVGITAAENPYIAYLDDIPVKVFYAILLSEEMYLCQAFMIHGDDCHFQPFFLEWADQTICISIIID